MEDDLLFTKGNRLYIPRLNDLQRLLMKECDTPWAGHNGWQRTYALLKRVTTGWAFRTMWCNLLRLVLYVSMTVKWAKLAGLLEPLPVPSRLWENMFLDLITRPPKLGEFDTILVIVDKLSKYAPFIPTPNMCSAEITAQLFFKHIVKLWEVPVNIINDLDDWFTRMFWIKLFKMLGFTLNISLSYHPQTDG